MRWSTRTESHLNNPLAPRRAHPERLVTLEMQFWQAGGEGTPAPSSFQHAMSRAPAINSKGPHRAAAVQQLQCRIDGRTRSRFPAAVRKHKYAQDARVFARALKWDDEADSAQVTGGAAAPGRMVPSGAARLCACWHSTQHPNEQNNNQTQ